MVYWLLNPELSKEVAIYPLSFGVVLLIIPLLRRIRVARDFRSNPNAGLRITWRIDGAKLAFESPGSSVVFPWGKLVRIKEGNTGFLLFVNPAIAYWLPKSGFSAQADMDQFRGYRAESGVKFVR